MLTPLHQFLDNSLTFLIGGVSFSSKDNLNWTLSVLDGWWCEGYQIGADGKGINGWAIGEDAHTSNQELQDRIDSESLYRLLEEEIAPLYYDRDADGIPYRWIQMMKASIKTNAPLFNTDRMIADYVTRTYAPGYTTISTPSLAQVIV